MLQLTCMLHIPVFLFFFRCNWVVFPPSCCEISLPQIAISCSEAALNLSEAAPNLSEAAPRPLRTSPKPLRCSEPASEPPRSEAPPRLGPPRPLRGSFRGHGPVPSSFRASESCSESLALSPNDLSRHSQRAKAAKAGPKSICATYHPDGILFFRTRGHLHRRLRLRVTST